jgi:hypothetical protein
VEIMLIGFLISLVWSAPVRTDHILLAKKVT